MDKAYTNSLYYHLRLTARYMEIVGKQLFKRVDIEVNIDEFGTLDLISQNEGLCQRDLAKILLKDRANTGRIISSLEEKGLIKIEIGRKNNRLIKKLMMTKKGNKFLEEVKDKFRKVIDEGIGKLFDGDEEDKIIELLNDFRNKLSAITEIDI